MIIRAIAAVAATVIVIAPASAAAACCTPPPPTEPQVSGWRLPGGNVCVQDQTKQISDGVWRAAVAWSKAEDINLIWRRNCAAYPQARTITVQEYRSPSDFYYGRCHVARVWTTGGYLKPGIVTRAALFVNLECRTLGVEDRAGLAAEPLGKAVGLTEQAPGDPSTVMGCAWLPTDRDYALVEQIYPW